MLEAGGGGAGGGASGAGSGGGATVRRVSIFENNPVWDRYEKMQPKGKC